MDVRRVHNETKKPSFLTKIIKFINKTWYKHVSFKHR